MRGQTPLQRFLRWVCPRTFFSRLAAMDRRDELAEFRRQCERQLRRPVADRIRFGFFRNPDPVRDAGVNRSFASMREYRKFCEESYPAYFGYAPATAK